MTVRVTGYGAAGDGTTDDSAAIARAIAACAIAGGGRVLFPVGVYQTGPIELKSEVELHLEEGARVQFSRNRADYPLVQMQFLGFETVFARSPLWGENLRNVAITGQGVFDGAGDAWRPVKKVKQTAEQWGKLLASGGVLDAAGMVWWPSTAARDGEVTVGRLEARRPEPVEAYLPYWDYLRPTLLKLSRCHGVRLEGPTFQNSPFWNLHLEMCEEVTVRNVTVLNEWWAQNGDGIDIDSCRDVRIEDSIFDVGDDAICLKSGKDEPGRRRGRPTENVVIRNCTVRHGHGAVTIGSEMSGGVRNVRVSDCIFHGTDKGLRFKSTRGRGGTVEDIRVERVTMSDIRGPMIGFDLFYEKGSAASEPVSERTPRFRDFHFREIICEGAQTALDVRGLPEMPVENITLEEIQVTAGQGIRLAHARNITLRDVRVQAKSGGALALEQHDVSDLVMERVEGLNR